MVHEQILTETIGRVGVIRLNRPEKLNARTNQMAREIRSQIATWNADDSIGAIILTGEGRAFCAGADVGDFADRAQANKKGEGEKVVQLIPETYELPTMLRKSKPTIAAINGYAVGVGLTMTLPCDIRIASTEAKLSIRFIKIGRAHV